MSVFYPLPPTFPFSTTTPPTHKKVWDEKVSDEVCPPHTPHTQVAVIEGQLRGLDERAMRARPGEQRNFGMSHINKRNMEVGHETRKRGVGGNTKTSWGRGRGVLMTC